MPIRRVQLVVGSVRGSSRAAGNNCNCSRWLREKFREIGQRKCLKGAQSQRPRNITACLVQLLLVGAGAMVLSALSRVAERSDWVQNA